MSNLRLEITLAFPEVKGGTLMMSSTDDLGKQVGGIAIDPDAAKALNGLILAIRKAQAYAIKVNEGQDNEEQTIKAVMMISHHDSNGVLPDESRQEI